MATFIFGAMQPHVGMTLVEALGTSPDFYVEAAADGEWLLAEHDVHAHARQLVWARALNARFWRAEVTKDEKGKVVRFSIYLLEGPEAHLPGRIWDRAIG